MQRVIRFGVLTLAGVFVVLASVWMLLQRPDIPYDNLEARYANTYSHWLSLPGHLRVHYRDQGNPYGPPVILVHGFAASVQAWEPWAKRLGDHYRIISLDLPGHGLTEAPPDYRASQDGNADIVDALAQNLFIERYVVAGNSMGGGVAWDDALRHPDHVRALILVDSGGLGDGRGRRGSGPLIFQILRNPVGRAILRDIDTRPLAESGLKMAYLDPKLVTPALIDRYVDLSRAPGHRDIILNMQSSPRRIATAATFQALKVPTLVMHGEEDKLIPLADGKALAAAIPGATLITYPAVGHVPMEQIPDRSAADVRAFLEHLPKDRR